LTSPAGDEEVAMPLHRSTENRILGGVCGGIAAWLGWSPLLVRVLYVLVSILSAAFPGIVVYIILWILMPRARS
jgi:phage shock protein PspC (stress-responsive transcriptional regulator)